MIKVILIDIDNTLLDFDAYVKESMENGFEKFGLGKYEDGMFYVFEKINSEMWQQIEKGEITYDELVQTRWNRIFAALNISIDGCRFEEYFKDCLFESAIPVEGASEILEYLKGKCILCVASNGPYEQQVNRLGKAEMLVCFSHLFISEKIGASKPSEKFFSYCLNEINVERKRHRESPILPSEVLMIGDSLTSDISGAAEIGFITCFFDRKNSEKPDGLSVDYVINKLEDIRKII